MTPSVRDARRQASALYDIARFRALRRPLSPVRFVVFGRGRSGSTTLVSLLDALPDVRCEGEILSHAVPLPRSYVHARCADTGAPAYGCKILSYQLVEVQPLRRRTEFVRRLSDDGFAILHLERENLVEHAVSNIRARELGFHRAAAAPERSEKIPIDPQELLRWMAKSEAYARFEAASLVDVPHLPLTYERDLAFAADHAGTLRRVAEFVHLRTERMPPAQSAYRKVSPRALQDSVANYAEIADVLAGTPYERHLRATGSRD